MKRGEIRWYAFRPPDKRRPILLLTREDVIEQLGEIVAVPVTRTVRGPDTEVLRTRTRDSERFFRLAASRVPRPHPGA